MQETMYSCHTSVCQLKHIVRSHVSDPPLGIVNGCTCVILHLTQLANIFQLSYNTLLRSVMHTITLRYLKRAEHIKLLHTYIQYIYTKINNNFFNWSAPFCVAGTVMHYTLQHCCYCGTKNKLMRPGLLSFHQQLKVTAFGTGAQPRTFLKWCYVNY